MIISNYKRIMENLKKNKILYITICVCILIISIIVCYFIDQKNKSNTYEYIQLSEENNLNSENENNEIQNKQLEDKKIIYIHITGEVIKPGVISIEEGARIKDIIERAGGMTELADTKKINLAYQVQDGQKIYIPNINDRDINIENTITEDSGDNIIIGETESTNNKKVNINTATQTELETISGIGPSTASKIIEYRKKNGGFKNIQDLKNVSGIGEAKYNKIKEEVDIK